MAAENIVCRASIKSNKRIAAGREAKRIVETEERIKSQRTNDDDDARGWSDGLVVWGRSILFDIFFYFIDMHPGEVNAIMACAVHVCLVDD